MQLQPIIIQREENIQTEDVLNLVVSIYNLPILESPSSDLMYIGGMGSIGIKQVSEIKAWNSRMPYGSTYKLGIIDGAERLTSEAQNSLLKTLEEPAENTLITLITSNYSRMLPTIISRCRVHVIGRQEQSNSDQNGPGYKEGEKTEDILEKASKFYSANLLDRLLMIEEYYSNAEEKDVSNRYASAIFVKELLQVATGILKQGLENREGLIQEIEFLKICLKSIESSGSLKIILEQLSISLAERVCN